MFERFTDRARRVIVLASEQARELQHPEIDLDHLVLALLAEGEGIAALVLTDEGFTYEQSRRYVEKASGIGEKSVGGHIPFTPRSKKALELALREALQLGHSFIGTEHLLLAIIRTAEKDAPGVNTVAGVRLPDLRKAVIHRLSDVQPAAEPTADTRAWRVEQHYGIHLYAINPDGDDQPIGTTLTPEIAAQIVAEHALVTAPYADDEHRGGSWLLLLAQLQKQISDLEKRVG